MSWVETQITWSAANSITVSSATEVVSDTFTLQDDTIEAAVQISADNQGTPAAGDTAIVRIRRTTGDILGDTGSDFDTAEHAERLMKLDTFATNTPGEDPARKTVDVSCASKEFKIGVVCAQAATRNIVIRARVIEHIRA